MRCLLPRRINQNWFCCTSSHIPPAGISNVEEVKASLKQRLEALVPPEAESWCRPISAVEFGHQFARPAERIVDVARERAVAP